MELLPMPLIGDRIAQEYVVMIGSRIQPSEPQIHWLSQPEAGPLVPDGVAATFAEPFWSNTKAGICVCPRPLSTPKYLSVQTAASYYGLHVDSSRVRRIELISAEPPLFIVSLREHPGSIRRRQHILLVLRPLRQRPCVDTATSSCYLGDHGLLNPIHMLVHTLAYALITFGKLRWSILRHGSLYSWREMADDCYCATYWTSSVPFPSDISLIVADFCGPAPCCPALLSWATRAPSTRCWSFDKTVKARVLRLLVAFLDHRRRDFWLRCRAHHCPVAPAWAINQPRTLSITYSMPSEVTARRQIMASEVDEWTLIMARRHADLYPAMTSAELEAAEASARAGIVQAWADLFRAWHRVPVRQRAVPYIPAKHDSLPQALRLPQPDGLLQDVTLASKVVGEVLRDAEVNPEKLKQQVLLALARARTSNLITPEVEQQATQMFHDIALGSFDLAQATELLQTLGPHASATFDQVLQHGTSMAEGFWSATTHFVAKAFQATADLSAATLRRARRAHADIAAVLTLAESTLPAAHALPDVQAKLLANVWGAAMDANYTRYQARFGQFAKILTKQADTNVPLIAVNDLKHKTNLALSLCQLECFGAAIACLYRPEDHLAMTAAIDAVLATSDHGGVTAAAAMSVLNVSGIGVAWLSDEGDSWFTELHGPFRFKRPTLLYVPDEPAHWLPVILSGAPQCQLDFVGRPAIESVPLAPAKAMPGKYGKSRRHKSNSANNWHHPSENSYSASSSSHEARTPQEEFHWRQRAVRFALPDVDVVEEYVRSLESLEAGARQDILNAEDLAWTTLELVRNNLPAGCVIPSVILDRVIHARSHLPPPVCGMNTSFGAARWTRVGGGSLHEGNPSFIVDQDRIIDPYNLAIWDAYSLVELREDCLVGHPIHDRTLLFVRDEESSLDTDHLISGSLNPARVACLHADGATITLDAPYLQCYGPHRYWIYPLRYTALGPLMAHIAGTPFFTPKVTSIGLFPTTRSLPSLKTMSAYFPADDAAYRAAYMALTTMLPKWMQPLAHDIRNEEQGLKQHSGKEPREVITQLYDQLRSIPTPPGYGVSRTPKSCASCGAVPSGRYKWRHRLCPSCQHNLNTVGFCSLAGSQVAARLPVPTCYPGIVRMPGLELPPNPSKWASVCIEDDDGMPLIHYRPEDLKTSRPNRGRGQLVPAVKGTLDELRGCAQARLTNNYLAGIACSAAYPILAVKSPYNTFKALAGRMYRKPANEPQPHAMSLLEELAPVLLPDFQTSPWPFERWLQSMPSNRRRALKNAYERYLERGLTKKDLRFNAFVKSELLPGFSKPGQQADFDDTSCYLLLGPLLDIIDRLINGPEEVAHAIVGPTTKPLTELCKKRWHSANHIFYASVGPEDMRAWLLRIVSSKTFIWCDYSMFDSTYSDAAWTLLEKFYRRSNDDPDFWRVLSAWRRPVGRCGQFKFRAPKAMNASGRDDTALANAILNGLVFSVSLAAAWHNIPILAVTTRHLAKMATLQKLAIVGDDSLCALPAVDDLGGLLNRLRHNIAQFGLEAKAYGSDRLEDAVFLGNRPYQFRGEWYWGRTIGRSTYKLGWVIAEPGRDVMAKMTGIAEMHTIISRGVPVLCDLADKIVELRAGCKISPVRPDLDRPWTRTVSAPGYDDSTLDSLVTTYQRLASRTSPCVVNVSLFTRDNFKSLIAEIKAVEQLPAVIENPLWSALIALDDL